MSHWWQNAGTDDETAEIDRTFPDQPADDQTGHIRKLIGNFESCHHKAERRIEILIDAIGAGATDKRPGKRSVPGMHPAERTWQTACDVLRAWLDGEPQRVGSLSVGLVRADELLQALGERTPLNAWQVQRVIERIDTFVHRDHRYDMLVCDLGDYGEPGGRPLISRPEHEALFLAQTRQTIIHDTDNGKPHAMSLALAIDMLMPCHWDFPSNLLLVLRAIGGEVHCRGPFAACGYNIRRAPLRPRAQAVVAALDAFSGRSSGSIDPTMSRRLGETNPQKRWLAACLSKTLRLQLHL